MLFLQEIDFMKLRTLLLKFMMSWWPFQEDHAEKAKKTEKNISTKWWVFETKSNYIWQVTWFLEDWIKQMKKDLSI